MISISYFSSSCSSSSCFVSLFSHTLFSEFELKLLLQISLFFCSFTGRLLCVHGVLNHTFTCKCFKYYCSWSLVIVSIVNFYISEKLYDAAFSQQPPHVPFSSCMTPQMNAKISSSLPIFWMLAARYATCIIISRTTVHNMQCKMC